MKLIKFSPNFSPSEIETRRTKNRLLFLCITSVRNMKMWVHLFSVLLLGLNACSAARLLTENKEMHTIQIEVACAGETKPWIASANNSTEEETNNLLELRIRESRTGGDAEHEFSSGLKVQGLSTSQPSPAVGHMQVSRVPKSEEKGAMSRVHEQRVLESTPSPGVGN